MGKLFGAIKSEKTYVEFDYNENFCVFIIFLLFLCFLINTWLVYFMSFLCV